MGKTVVNKRTGEEMEANNPFFQFYKHNFKTMRKAVHENPNAAKLFMFLIENMDSRNAIIVSQKALEEALDISVRTIQMAVKYLVENKYIMVHKSGTSNVYCVNADIVWTQRADKKMFAKFDAKVYLTASEQSEEQGAILTTEFQKVVSFDDEGNKTLEFLGTEFTAEYNKDRNHVEVTNLNPPLEKELKMVERSDNDKQPDNWSNFSGNPEKPVDFDEERIEKLTEKVLKKRW